MKTILVAHTPGPWHINAIFPSEEHTFIPTVSISAFDTEFETDVRLADIPDVETEDSEYMANARLMSAAPELLEALKECLPNTPGWNAADFAGRPWLSKAQTAISKAQGEL